MVGILTACCFRDRNYFGNRSGPIAHGDIRTIARHIEKFELVEPSFAPMYRAMARHAVDIALRNGSFTEEKDKEIRSILECCGEQE